MNDLIDATMAAVEAAFRRFESAVPQPKLVSTATGQAFRHVEQTPKQALIQKLARQISGVHAVYALLDKALLQEQGALQRVLDEISEDIDYICFGLIMDDWTELHDTYLTEFWKEEFDQPTALESGQKRGMPKRKNIRAYLARIQGLDLDPSTLDRVGHTVHKAYSGFVHAASPHIMDMVEGFPPRFRISGQFGSPFHEDSARDAINYVYRLLISSTLIARVFEFEDLFDDLLVRKRQFDTTTDVLGERRPSHSGRSSTARLPTFPSYLGGLTLFGPGGSQNIPPNAVVFWIDETGHEEFRQKDFPLFGFGGIACRAHEFEWLIDRPWKRLKRRLFGDAGYPLHENDIPFSDRPHFEACIRTFNGFFKRPFHRLGASADESVVSPADLPPFNAIAGAFLHRIDDTLAHFPDAEEVVLVFEDNRRAKKLFESTFGALQARDQNGAEVPTHLFWMPKSGSASGLQVADFVAHTCGRQQRLRHQGGSGLDAVPDFKAMFRSVDRRYATYIAVERVERNEPAAEPDGK